MDLENISEDIKYALELADKAIDNYGWEKIEKGNLVMYKDGQRAIVIDTQKDEIYTLDLLNDVGGILQVGYTLDHVRKSIELVQEYKPDEMEPSIAFMMYNTGDFRGTSGAANVIKNRIFRNKNQQNEAKVLEQRILEEFKGSDINL